MERVKLEDNKYYLIVDEIKIEGINYIYLSEEDNPSDICVRKEINNGKDISGLDNQEEFDKAMKAYKRKYEDLFE